MLESTSKARSGQTGRLSANGRNGRILDTERGSLVIVCIDSGLAAEMRKVILPALDNTREMDHLKAELDRRRVVIAYRGPGSRAAADQAAGWIQSKCHPERVATIDLTDKFGFPPGPPESFPLWWEEEMGMGKFDDGPDFLRQVEIRSTVRRSSPILDDDEDDGSDVKDPIGDIDPIAFHGVLGRLALMTQPETEANPVFVLMHLLAFFGATLGRGPHFIVSASRHYLNLFIGLIGISGWSRKGTAADVARTIWRAIDPGFTDENIPDGLNSGAGLLYQLRDASVKIGPKGQPIQDAGVEDKRRVFLEEELGSVLKQGHRENDTLLDLLRKFFDGRESVRSNTKDPTKVSGAHVAIVGHCTPEDLEIHLSDADKANGTANRLMWFFGVRSKILPRGGDVFGLLSNFLSADLEELRQTIEWCKGVGQIRRAPEIEKRWEELYRSLNQVPPGRLGAFFVRAPIQIMRIASIYALADRSALIRDDHLDASLAIWKHSERSLRWIFKADVDPRAEKLLAALRANQEEGLTKTDIVRTVFNKTLDSKTVDELLMRLLAYRLVVRDDPRSAGGRPAAHYRFNRW